MASQLALVGCARGHGRPRAVACSVRLSPERSEFASMRVIVVYRIDAWSCQHVFAVDCQRARVFEVD